MHNDSVIINTDLVLVGGGHSHLFVLRYFAMNPVSGLRLTLVTRDLHTPYSGMLPGYIAGHYTYDEAHIDLLPLAHYAGARVIHAEVDGLDAARRQISIAGRPPLDYDLLSINIGSRPTMGLATVESAEQFAIKPVDRFLQAWGQLEQRLREQAQTIRLAIVGAGAGGVELALALQHRAQGLMPCRGKLAISLFTDSYHLLPSHNARTQERFQQLLAQRGIRVHFNFPVDAFDGRSLSCQLQPSVAADAAIWVTHASPAGWLAQSGLALDATGFIEVNACLQSTSHDEVFAAGDIASVTRHPRPKSGVFAVRQGVPLAQNLARFVAGQPLRDFKPQSRFLSLISTGDRYAVASRGEWAFAGRWCWRLKDYIDRKFVRRFSNLPVMRDDPAGAAELSPMHCGGCGAKVGSAVLERVLSRIGNETGIDIAANLGHADDAALIEVPAGRQLVQTVDHFRSFIDDPYVFGQIAANHALGDIYAMGIEADSALVIANVAYASEDRQAQDLYQLMSGVVETLSRHDTRLAGGHSGEASQMSCGLSLNGFADPNELILKSGMRADELLILCKPLGSGVLFAADMRGQARGEWIDAALAQMLVSSREAARCLRRYNASACTDVTGFGFAGHLFEMARASACAVEILLPRLPVYAGAVELTQRGIESSLLAQNSRIRHRIEDHDGLATHALYPLLFDPQTAGGLLASLPSASAQDCLDELRGLGYTQAQIVARAVSVSSPDWQLKLVSP